MDTIETREDEFGTVETPVEGQNLDDFVSAFTEDIPDTDDDDFGFDDSEEAADQPATEETEQTETPTVETSEDDAADQWFELKHLDETKKVNREEVVTLAQKGMDYDRIREKLDAANAAKELSDGYKAFVEELAKASNTTPEELIDTTRAKVMVAEAAQKGEKLTEEEAKAKLKADRESKAEAVKQAKAKEEAEAADQRARQDNFARFTKEFPTVKAEDIPKEVWEEFGDGKGKDLAGIYARYALKEERKKYAALEQNTKNKERTTGSRKTSGASTPMDAFDEGWG